jgi:PKD repeat protein
MKKLILLLSTFALAFSMMAQLPKSIDYTDQSVLKKLSEELSIKATIQKQAAEAKALEYGWVIRRESPSGEIVELMDLDEFGQPIYYITNNTAAAATISTRHLHPGGNLGLSLTGQGMIVGEWDGGAVRTTHREFGDRVWQRDNATTVSSHATHVAGTLIASGVTPAAKGMAYEARLWAHEWTLDGTEMASAAQNGLLVSNHSYGTITGWRQESGTWYWYGTPSVSETVDYRFGFYDLRTREWDQIARNAPYYLIVKSAGNDRNEGPGPGTSHRVLQNGSWVTSTATRSRDGAYDCISTYGTAKNILTVGAVNDLNNGWQSASGVSMSSFSGWGPTDDGRIKPDIVGNGVSLYSSSSTSNSSYSNSSGTSMSAPNVTGSLILLQQHFNNLFGRNMFASTLKGLVIHTADEAGPSPGPDYMFGWGLMNSRKAAMAITNADASYKIEELSITNGQVLEIPVYSDGRTPLKATICWTDLAGTVHAAALNDRRPKLVNDLDLRIVAVSGGSTSLPWILNPDQPDAAAQKGDNFRDNVEVVELGTPAPGRYVLRISHKGTLGTPQNVSLIVSGISKPVIAADFEASPIGACVGQSIVFINKSTGEDLTYQWEFEGAEPSVSSDLEPEVSYKTPGLYSVKLIVSADGVSDTLIKDSYVVVLPLVEQEANITTSATAICEGEEVSFSAEPIGEASGPTFRWLLNGEVVSESLSFSSSTLKNGDVVVFQMLSDAACVINPEYKSDPIQINVTPIQTPGVSIAPSAAEICAGEEVSINAVPNHGGDNPVFQWSLNGVIQAATGNQLTLSQAANGDLVSLLLVSDALCRDSDTALSNEVTLVVFDPIAAPSISRSGDTLFASAGFASYQWFLNGSLLTTTTVPFILAQVSGNYSVVVADENECMAESAPFSYTASSANSFAAAGLQLFPNPGTGAYTISFGAITPSAVRVHDTSGKVILSTMLQQQAGNFSLDLKGYPAGAYIVVIETVNRAYVTKLIQQ